MFGPRLEPDFCKAYPRIGVMGRRQYVKMAVMIISTSLRANRPELDFSQTQIIRKKSLKNDPEVCFLWVYCLFQFIPSLVPFHQVKGALIAWQFQDFNQNLFVQLLVRLQSDLMPQHRAPNPFKLGSFLAQVAVIVCPKKAMCSPIKR